jgi:hypothetical protein
LVYTKDTGKLISESLGQPVKEIKAAPSTKKVFL